jgi:hypothetical protein
MVPNFRCFSLCLMTAEGKLKVLFHSDSYEQCNLKLEHYVEMFPLGLVDIYSRGVMLNAEVAA